MACGWAFLVKNSLKIRKVCPNPEWNRRVGPFNLGRTQGWVKEMGKVETHNRRMIGARIADRYLVTGTIGSGGMGLVYSAIPFEDPSREVAIKVIRSKRMGPDVLMRFQKEAALMSRLHHPCIISFLELGLLDREGSGFIQGRTSEDDPLRGAGSVPGANQSPGGYYIVMERANGRNLKELISRSGRQSLRFFFQLGSQMAQALDYTHRKNIIHRDIKPQNIIVDRPHGDSREVHVKVLDFGIASLSEAVMFTGKHQSDGKKPGDVADEIAGTPLYMAPELTRMIDAPIDQRVDLYSLGCVFYEVLSGTTPFSADSRDKLEKLHAFSVPEPISSRCPDIPPYVEAIVHKLLAKHPDERYQSAFGLQADLAKAMQLSDAGIRSRDAMILGRLDRIDVLTKPMKFSGRATELAVLREQYDAVASLQGRSRLTVIRGAAGSGKSRLISEFREDLVRRQIRFVSGRFSSHESALPFNALANAFNEYLLRLSKSKSAEAVEFQDRVKTLLGPLAHQVAQVVPALQPFLSDLPEPEVLFGADEEGFRAFAKVFSDFTRCFSSDAAPFIVILDDLQWADSKSLRLIDQFFSNANSQRFLLIVSVRSEGVPSGSEVESFLNRFSKLKRRFVEVDVGPVSRDALEKLLGVTVGWSFTGEVSTEKSFIDWLYQKTAGNFLHLNELLRALISLDLLQLDGAGGWKVDFNAIVHSPPKVESVDLVLGRLAEFRESDRNVLEAASVAGMVFHYELLRDSVGGDSPALLVQSLQRAVNEGILVRASGDPDTRSLGKAYAFVHSRAREDIYTAIPVKKRAMLHLAIARRLERSVPVPSGRIVFALAQHYTRAIALGGESAIAEGNANSGESGNTGSDAAITFGDLHAKSIKYNIAAGETALKSKSWQTAETYFKTSESQMNLIGEPSVMSSDLLRVREVLADLAAIQNKNSEAFKRYRELMNSAVKGDKRHKLALKAARFYGALGVFTEGLRIVESTLGDLDVKIHAGTHWNRIVALFWLWFDGTFLGRKMSRQWGLLASTLRRRSNRSSSVSGDIQHSRKVALLQEAGHILSAKNHWRALVAHDQAFSMALQCLRGGYSGRGGIEPSNAIRLVSERAATLACRGYFQAAFRDFDLVMEISKVASLRSDFAYSSMLRVMSVDYLRGRHDELSDHLRSVSMYLNHNEDRLMHGFYLAFEMHRELHRLNLDQIKVIAGELPEYRALRSPVSSRAVMIASFAYCLRDSRDEVVNFAESFLKHRRLEGGRMDDSFTLAITAMVALVRGELEKARKSYARLIQEFSGSTDGEFLWPFENDMMGLFVVTFPMLFQRESGVPVLPEAQIKVYFNKVLGKIETGKLGDRSVPLLVRARILDYLGSGNGSAPALYDRSLRQAKLAGDNLVQILGNFWFGLHFAGRGVKPRMDYARRAAILAAKGRVKALSEVIARSSGIKKSDVESSLDFVDSVRKTGRSQGSSVLRHSVAAVAATQDNDGLSWVKGRLHPVEEGVLRIVANAELRRLDEMAELSEVMSFLSRTFNGSRVFCLRKNPGGGLTQVTMGRPSEDGGAIAAYLTPYTQLKTTLFLPLHDAPWLKPPSSSGSVGNTYLADNSDDVATQAPVLLSEIDARIPEPLQHDSAGSSDPIVRGLGAVVPVRWKNETVGLLFVEDSSALGHEDSALLREALDATGGLVAVTLEKRRRMMSYRSGSFLVEPQPWLQTWDHGNFRAQRETGWYLGLNFGEDRHVLFYLTISGPEEIRARLGAKLWFSLLAYRNCFMADPEMEIEMNDIRNHIAKFLISDKAYRRLESIDLSFSVLHRNRKVALSGHFGGARPTVINGQNKIAPGNESLLLLSGGKELRYWDVEANLGEQQVLVVGYDTSKLDGVDLINPDPEDSSSGIFDDILVLDRPAELHQVLVSRLPLDALPRYYVAMMRQRVDETSRNDVADSKGSKMVG